ncbi:hypothetical protein BKA82DRAFT_640346 [Pisolithus tinctorius]|uniref:Wax synthase domain-containing protein n=1 Tax=Pisolithus tinctorius Marx 270 TaxID=870435 RepID=A0A0C3JZ48_PISTI|nr:hypothetical protein BKA82DRAFT_640346 [Pisolithus tinctorius]KIO02682.1 hypothetical protein M404DRAFT_640346 [Pisolithus tinctorius Marx 270]
MAYLARRPETFLYRLMLLPLVVSVTLGSFFRFIIPGAEYTPANWGIAAFTIFMVSRVIDWAWRPEGMLKVGEEKLSVFVNPPNQRRGGTSTDGTNASRTSPSIWERHLPSWLYDALELFCTLRGIGWTFGVGVHVPREHKSLERFVFLRQTLASALRRFVVLDFCESFVKLVPGVNSPEGGTIFRPELPIPQRYILSTAVHVATGSMFIASFELLYDLFTLIGVGLLFNDPLSWPPVMDHPWQSDSLHEFWAKRWHQLLRETFFVYGGFIGGAIAGNIGIVFGTFLGSGLLHELAICSHGRGLDPQGILFFVQQAPLLILEKLWTRVTGHRVNGIYGRLWVLFCIVILGQSLVDSWHRRGLGGCYVIDPRISPVRLLLLPCLGWFTEFLGLHRISALLS